MPRFNWKTFCASRLGAKVFFIALILFNLNMRPIPSGDTAPAAMLPFAVMMDGTIHLDRFEPWFNYRYGGHAYFFHRAHGHVFSGYPIFHALPLVPLYTPLLLIRGLSHWSMEELVLLARVLEKLSATLIAACSVLVFFLLARRLLDVNKALLLTVIFGFATETWAISSQALWQHGMSQLMILLSLYCLQRSLETNTMLFICGAGIFAALSAAMRPSNVLFVLISGGLILLAKNRWRLFASYAGFGLFIGSGIAAYNFYVFDHIRGGYQEGFNGAFASGLPGILFSPGRGLFFYSPILLLAIPGVYFWFRQSSSVPRIVYLIALLFAAGHILLYAQWGMWWGGHCFGPRLLTDITPCLTLLLVPFFLAMSRSRALVALFSMLLVFSVYVQFLGTFSYPRGLWDNTPTSVDVRPDRLWNWSNNPVSSAVRNGIDFQGYRRMAGIISAWIKGQKPDLTGIKIAGSPPKSRGRRLAT
jgi:hypothetical protein